MSTNREYRLAVEKAIVRAQKSSKKISADLAEEIKTLQARKRGQDLIDAGESYTTR